MQRVKLDSTLTRALGTLIPVVSLLVFVAMPVARSRAKQNG